MHTVYPYPNGIKARRALARKPRSIVLIAATHWHKRNGYTSMAGTIYADGVAVGSIPYQHGSDPEQATAEFLREYGGRWCSAGSVGLWFLLHDTGVNVVASLQPVESKRVAVTYAQEF